MAVNYIAFKITLRIICYIKILCVFQRCVMKEYKEIRAQWYGEDPNTQNPDSSEYQTVLRILNTVGAGIMNAFQW